MTTCTSCGNDVTGKKFCPECGTPVQPTAAPVASTSTCPRCNGVVKPGAAFCMHCGSALNAHTAIPTVQSQSLTRQCPACHADVPLSTAFCTNCGQNMQTGTPPPVPATTSGVYCNTCGRQNAPGLNFCGGCGSPINTTAPSAPQTGYPQTGSYGQPSQPYAPQYGQPQYNTQYPPQQPAYQQPYPQQAYGQPPAGYQQQPMLGQQPMVLRCPICMAMSPVGTTNCPGCRTSLAGIVPVPANMPQQGQQGGGLGGFLQGSGGNMAVGALGGAAAVIGGEMLLHEIEHPHHRGYDYEDRRDGDGGMLGDLGNLANDVGLF